MDEIHIVFTRFVSMLTQRPDVIRLLPLEVVEGEEAPADDDVLPLYEFEPSAEDVLDGLLPKYVASRIHFCMLQAAASELASRQRAMKSATDNAQDLIERLTARPEPGAAGARLPRKSARSSVAPARWPTRTPGASERDDCHGYREEQRGGAARGVGRVARVIGPVVDVEFPADAMPDMYNALEVDITLGDDTQTITLEVALHVGDNIVRAISMKPTDGLVRGTEVRDTGAADLRAGRRRHQGPGLVRDRQVPEPGRVRVRDHRALADPPQGAGLRPARVQDRDAGDRHQGAGPAHPVRAGRQDRPVRRCGRRQDRA